MTNRIIINNNYAYQKQIKKRSKQDLYNYLSSRNFTNYLEPIEETSTKETFKYIEDNISKEDKAIDLIYILTNLHTKTTTYEPISQDEIKTIYEDTKDELYRLKDYYYSLQDNIEMNLYFSPSKYLLLRNISNIYKLLNLGDQLIDKWYNISKEEKTTRKALLHQNLTTKNLKQEENNYYLTSWDNYKKDLVVYDFLNFYQNEYKSLELSPLFDLYNSKYQLTNSEKLLLFSKLTLIPKVMFNKSEIENTITTKYLIDYISKTKDFILKYYKEN